MEDLLNEIASDMKSRMNVGGFGRRTPNPPGPNPQWRALIIANSVLLAAIVLIVLVFGGGQKGSSKELDQIKVKLEQLEEQVGALSAAEQAGLWRTAGELLKGELPPGQSLPLCTSQAAALYANEMAERATAVSLTPASANFDRIKAAIARARAK